MSHVTMYHNPRCSKSRQTLALLEERGITPRIVHYLDTPPDAGTLCTLLDWLGIAPRGLLRTGEAEYTQLGLDDEALDDDTLIEAIASHPVLMQRPVVVCGERAAIGRPPERVLEIL